MASLNIINKLLLKAMLLPKAFYRNAGANIPQLKTILTYKLMMDDRRPNTLQQTKQHTQAKEVSGATIGTIVLTTLMGLMFLISFFATKDVLTSFTIFFSMFIIMLALTLITDFTQVLIDVRDNFIILPKPVNDATFVIARILHITIHVFKIMLPMAIPSLITVGIKFGTFTLAAFSIMVVASAIFTIFLINALYIFVLRFSSPEKFKNIISYIQIAFAILMYGSYQIVPRLIEDSFIEKATIGTYSWLLTLPPYWFACSVQQAAAITPHWVVWMGAALSLIMPVIGIFAVIKYFAPTFNQKLSLIAAGTNQTAGNDKATMHQPASYSNLLAKICTRKGPERAGFLLSWKMMIRNRDFKLKVYPGIGYITVLLIMMLLRKKADASIVSALDLSSPQGSKVAFVGVLYFTGLVSLSALQQFNYSEHFKASWIFKSAPLRYPGKLISGATKAAIAQFSFPVFMVIALMLLIINGLPAVLHVLLAFSNLCLISSLLILAGKNALPWSMPPNKTNQGTTVIKTLGLMLLLGIICMVHALLLKYQWAIAILFLISATLVHFIFREINQYGWNSIKTD